MDVELLVGLMLVGFIVNVFEVGMYLVVSLLLVCYIVDDLNVFFEYWKVNLVFLFFVVVMCKGEIVDWCGLVFGGFLKKLVNSIV